jgi:3',5'-cyclic AMP phosphodiesterase CpdA
VYRNDMTKKEIERAFAERTPTQERELRGLLNCDRRQFLRTSLKFAGMAAAAGLIPDHTFQIVSAAHAEVPGAAPQVKFRFAYISDSHLYARGMTHRFAKAVAKAVDDINALDPQPDFVLFGGDLAQLGRKEELALGRDILKGVRAPLRMMVGEHDWYYDLGDEWRHQFGPDYYTFEHKGVLFVVLNSVVEKDFWTAKGYTPAERMAIVAGLDDNRQSSFEVGQQQRDWLQRKLRGVKRTQPVVVFSHSPLYKLYKPWNFWTDDAEPVQALLSPFDTVTVIHGHTHQLLTNRIGNIHFHGMLSTAWPWPYAPQGLPEYTVQMSRNDPFNQFDGCGDGTVDVLTNGRADKHYNLWAKTARTVTAAELSGEGTPQLGGYKGPSY